MNNIKYFGCVAAGSGIIGNCVGNLAFRFVTHQSSFTRAIITGGVFGVMADFALRTSKKIGNEDAGLIYFIAVSILGTAALTPNIVKLLTHYSMSYCESSIYACISNLTLFAFSFYRQ